MVNLQLLLSRPVDGRTVPQSQLVLCNFRSAAGRALCVLLVESFPTGSTLVSI